MINAQRSISIFVLALLILVSSCSSSVSPTLAIDSWTGEDIEARSTFDSNSRFIIYLHGKIIEDQGVDAVHPEYGRYEYFETLSFLASSGGQIISDIRQAGIDGVGYARTVSGWINQMLDAGVPAQNISVVGFSKGAGIAIFISDILENPKINFVLIAICGDWTNSDTNVQLNGRILSLYETSDELGGSCQNLADRSPGLSDFKEISFSTGEGHGAFYQAESFWLDEVIEWIVVE